MTDTIWKDTCSKHNVSNQNFPFQHDTAKTKEANWNIIHQDILFSKQHIEVPILGTLILLCLHNTESTLGLDSSDTWKTQDFWAPIVFEIELWGGELSSVFLTVYHDLHEHVLL